MSRSCEIIGIKTQYGGNRKHRRGKSGAGGVWRFKAPRTTRTWKPNIRKARVLTPAGEVKRVNVSMKAYKKLRKEGQLEGYLLMQ